MATRRRNASSSDKSKTIVWGSLTSVLWSVFRQNSDDEHHLHFSKLRAACNALDLFPSTSQVHEMLMCAIEYGSPCKPDHITFGEFCVLVSELRSYYNINPKAPVPHSLIKVRSELSLHKKKRRVFLGGSCNPTRWRSEIAIPYFKDHGITFYNPQVQHWKPELMELEAQAKQTADVLFFVIDSKTRAISSMIEVAYLVATQRQVVVIMCEYKDTNIVIDGEKLSDSEMLDLVKGRLILTDLVERNSVPIFADIHKALKCTQKILSNRMQVQNLKLTDGAQPVRHGHLKLGRALLELREAFNSVDSSDLGYLTSKDVCLAYKSCTGEDLDTKWLKQRRKVQDEFVYEEFCAIVTEHRQQAETPGYFQRFFTHILQPFRWLVSKFSPPEAQVEEYEDEEIRDVYLGGSSGEIQWRNNIVIPSLRKHGLSFVDPAVHDWDQKLIPIHVALRENCRLLFYVISSDRRSLGSMCEAGYYIGKGCRMVLCIQNIPKEAVIDSDKLSEQSIKDYNRGREYLSDLANREGVPLFENIEEASSSVIAILTEQPSPCS
ncbi:uncharacterized protein LOC132716070 isoform X2 [Ruditapes philippinarum]|uniref:uncharacterized protein LOC132716070 isoform X2 n=1 Tax=Ruditapes philippinarum TaxID=129788 RepID=UPI00295AA4CE|nr:uncharacterized protein LOC132716070 isoform X2 [Ruditapes philippinarum]